MGDIEGTRSAIDPMRYAVDVVEKSYFPICSVFIAI
jgi:hypothetical protein